jgi:hypothetical protein
LQECEREITTRIADIGRGALSSRLCADFVAEVGLSSVANSDSVALTRTSTGAGDDGAA